MKALSEWNPDMKFILISSGHIDVPVALETGSVLVGWRQMAGQTDCGAEELRRTFSLECCLALQQNLEPFTEP